MAGPQYTTLPQANRNWWEPAMQQTGNLLTQLMIAKMAHNMRMEETDRALKAKEVESRAAREEKMAERGYSRVKQSEYPDEAYIGGEPVGVVNVGGTMYKQRPPAPVMANGRVIGHVDATGKLSYLPKSASEEAGGGSAPAAMREFEMTQYGAEVPQLRGTPEYIKNRLDWIRQTKEQNPALDWTARQFDVTRQKEASSMRQEFNQLPEVKNYVEIKNKLDIMKEAQKEATTSGNNIAVDQAIITTFNKITDPQSVVRESEYIRTKEDLSLWNRAVGAYEKLKKGGAGITQEDRDAMVKMASKFADVSESKYNSRLKEYKGYFVGYGLDPNTYLKPYGSSEAAPNPTNKPPAKKDEFEVGAVYEDASGVRKKYLGNGKWGDI